MLGFHGWLHILSTVTIAVLLTKYVDFNQLAPGVVSPEGSAGASSTGARSCNTHVGVAAEGGLEGNNNQLPQPVTTHTLEVNLHEVTPTLDLANSLGTAEEESLLGNGNVTLLVQHGSSVWCWGDRHTDRICRFRNLCYMPGSDNFVFFHSPQSIMSGLPVDRFSPTLLDMSSVWDHNMQYFNFVDLPATKAESFKVEFIETKSLIFRRFNPDNIMHVIHDDLLPMYYTLQMVTGGHNPNISAFDVQLVFMEGWSPGDFADLYEAFSQHRLLFKSDLGARDIVTCFKDAYVGISKATTWYQYGFREPQGPIPGSQVTARDVKQFTTYLKSRLGTDFMQVPNGQNYIVLFTRKHNRLILNEVDLTFALVRELKIKVLSVGVETHSVSEIIAILSKASILMGMHGSLLSLTMFLPPGAILIELFPYAVNPNNYTPYKTLSNLPGMGIFYRAWRNMDAKNTVTHPTRPWDTGGIAHLEQEVQDRILSSSEVPKHLCCRDPEWFFRIYQDTVVDIPSFLGLTQAAIQQRDKQFNATGGVPGGAHSPAAPLLAPDPSDALMYKRIFPAVVQTLRCEGNQDRQALHNENAFTPPSLWLSWQPPWNLKYLQVRNVHYEVWIQEAGQENYTAWLLSKTAHQFSMGLKPETRYNIWVRCIINDNVQGPFNQEHISCST